MKKASLLLSGFILMIGIQFGCSPGVPFSKSGSELSVVFYNVENLYDTIDDPVVNDNEFLPDSRKAWTQERYLRKLQDIAAVMNEAGGGNPPSLIGLCEVENRQVLEDFVITGRMKRGRYGIVHQDSPDGRGIDVAFLYQRGRFTVKGHEVVRVMLPQRTRLSTRDILYVWGDTKEGDELHIFVSHWPSRVGGVQQTENHRLAAADVLRGKTDSLFRVNKDIRIIIMGDFNDTPRDKSIKETLGALHPDEMIHPSLVNLMYPAHIRDEGSYYYAGSFDMLDHVIVSSGLMTGNGLTVSKEEGFVFIRDWITYTNAQGHKVPNRTYVGDRYTGGISDHFPVGFTLIFKK